jgi:hypothetical protein
MVSGTVSLPARGTFHHSLTVLSAIGHQGVFRLSGWSRQIRTGFLGPRATWDPTRESSTCIYGGITLCAATFQYASTSSTISYSPPDRQIQLNGPTTPGMQRLPAITHDRFSLFRFRSPLLTESRLFSLPVGTEMFHFPTFPPTALCVQTVVTAVSCRRVSPFGDPRINARLAAPRGLSQPPTSFFGSWCQGIHHVPLLTWSQRCSRPLCSSQGTGGNRPTFVAYAQRARRSTRTGPAEEADAHSLRTQQRAWAGRPLSSAFHAAYATVLTDELERPAY